MERKDRPDEYANDERNLREVRSDHDVVLGYEPCDFFCRFYASQTFFCLFHWILKRHMEQGECPLSAYWTVPKSILEDISVLVLTEDGEVSGAVLFDSATHEAVDYVNNEHGEKDSVNIKVQDDQVLSFHTHPVTAYRQAHCVYGHPSSDDLSEYINLAVNRGLVNHAVFSVEGVYLVQVSRRFVRFARNECDEGRVKKMQRNVYDEFHPYHGKRTFSHVSKHGYEPGDFIRAVNDYEFTDERGHPGKMFRCSFYPSDVYYDLSTRDTYDMIRSNGFRNISFSSNPEDLVFRFVDLKGSRRRNSIVSSVIDHCSPCEREPW